VDVDDADLSSDADDVAHSAQSQCRTDDANVKPTMLFNTVDAKSVRYRCLHNDNSGRRNGERAKKTIL